VQGLEDPREATPNERAGLWAEVTSFAPAYLKEQQRTEREIPLMILEPMDG
jgi:hypothetical protein